MPIRRGKSAKYHGRGWRAPGQGSFEPEASYAPAIAGALEIHLRLGSGRSARLDFTAFANGLAPDEEGALSVPRPQIARMFWEVFARLGNLRQVATINQDFSDLRRFIRFLDRFAESGTLVLETSQIDEDVLLAYRAYLWAEQDLSVAARRRTWCSVVSTLAFARGVRPGEFRALPERLPRWKGGKVAPAPVVTKEVLSDAALVQIVSAAEEDQKTYAEARENILAVLERAARSRGESPDLKAQRRRHALGYWGPFENAAYAVLLEHGPCAPMDKSTAQMLRYHGHPSWSDIVGAYVPLGEGGLIADFLQIAIRLALNPSSIATLSRDCLQPFRLPQYEILEYDKPRAGTARGKMLIVPKSGVVAKTVRRLLERTEPLVATASEDARNLLFLYRRISITSAVPGVVAGLRPTSVFMKRTIQAFIRRHTNCCGVPNFTIEELRAAVATNLYLETRDVLRVKRLLGHKRLSVTLTYLRGRALAREGDRQMAQAIRDHEHLLYSGSDRRGRARILPVIANVLEGSADVAGHSLAVMVREGRISQRDKDTVMRRGYYTGFARCARPYDAPWKEVPKGTLCTEVNRCLQCEHAFILEEDLWKVLLDRQRVVEEREQYSPEGWAVLYGDRYLMLSHIVTRFSGDAQRRAELRFRHEMNLLAGNSDD